MEELKLQSLMQGISSDVPGTRHHSWQCSVLADYMEETGDSAKADYIRIVIELLHNAVRGIEYPDDLIVRGATAVCIVSSGDDSEDKKRMLKELMETPSAEDLFDDLCNRETSLRRSRLAMDKQYDRVWSSNSSPMLRKWWAYFKNLTTTDAHT